MRFRLSVALFAIAAFGQNPPPAVVAGIPVNYDEAKIGSYTLPDPLVLSNGKPVKDAKTWTSQRRPEIVRLFEENQYGRTPGRPADMTFDVFDKGTPAFDGKAHPPPGDHLLLQGQGRAQAGPAGLPACRRRETGAAAAECQLLGEFERGRRSRYQAGRGVGPRSQEGPCSARRASAGSIPRRSWPRASASPPSTTAMSIRISWVALPNGVRAQYLKPGQTEPAPDEWGSISAWAWGASRALDYLETDKGVDAKRVAITGISRFGKTVMWAGAHDPRFAMVIASCSGEGGAALSRRNYGETIAHLTEPTRYPYQFAANYGKFAQAGGRVSGGCPYAGRADRARVRFCCRPATRTSGPIRRANFSPPSRPSRSTSCSANRAWARTRCPLPGKRSCTTSATTCMPAGTAPSRGLGHLPEVHAAAPAEVRPRAPYWNSRGDREWTSRRSGNVCPKPTGSRT